LIGGDAELMGDLGALRARRRLRVQALRDLKRRVLNRTGEEDEWEDVDDEDDEEGLENDMRRRHLERLAVKQAFRHGGGVNRGSAAGGGDRDWEDVDEEVEKELAAMIMKARIIAQRKAKERVKNEEKCRICAAAERAKKEEKEEREGGNDLPVGLDGEFYFVEEGERMRYEPAIKWL
jgi:hypothetical protein